MKAKTYKITSLIKCPLFLLLCVLCVLCVSISAQDWKTVRDGIEYAEVTRKISGLKVNMNLLRLDLTKVRLDVVHAMDAAIGTEKTSSIAARHGAFAAINAGFFRLDTSIFAGDAAGALQIDGRMWSESANDRVGLIINNRRIFAPVLIEHLRFNFSIYIFRPGKGGIGRIEASGVNRERKKGEIIIFTPEFHRTTLTNSDGVEVIVRKNKCTDFRAASGNNLIPADGFVISAETSRVSELVKFSKCNDRFDLRPSLTTVDKSGKLRLLFYPETLEDAVAGVPQLIKDGKIDITWEQEKTTKSFVETRHPRTAIAMLKGGKFLIITVDGRSEASGGIGLQDLAEYLLSLGATDAMNLDGGGSTTMFVDGKVVNHPSDKEGERKVSDVILVTPRKKK